MSRLYAQNITASQDFRSELRHMGYERKTSLKHMEKEIQSMRKELGKFRVDTEELLYLPTERENEMLSDVTNRLPVLENMEKGGRRVKYRNRR